MLINEFVTKLDDYSVISIDALLRNINSYDADCSDSEMRAGVEDDAASDTSSLRHADLIGLLFGHRQAMLLTKWGDKNAQYMLKLSFDCKEAVRRFCRVWVFM